MAFRFCYSAPGLRAFELLLIFQESP